MSRRSTVSASESTNTNISTQNVQEETMNTNTQNTTNTQKYFTITIATGRQVQIPEETAYLLLGVSNTALKEYERKASETTIGKTNPRAKDANSIKYDQNMLFRMQAMHAFIHKVLEGVTIPEKDNTTVIDQLNNL